MAEHTLFPSISEQEKADSEDATTDDLEADPRCNYQGCKRKVDDPSLRCWQHRADED